MTTNLQSSESLVQSVTDALWILDLLATDFAPRSLKAIHEAATQAGHSWSNAKIHGLLVTMKAAGWLTQDELQRWIPSTHLAQVSVQYQQSIIQRAGQLLAEVRQVCPSLAPSTSPLDQ